MDTGMLFLRSIHILGGVFWAGTLLFFAILLEPSVREAGPDGARVMQGLARRRYFTIMPIVAGLTVLTGIDLLRRASANFAPAWFGSGVGVTLTAGSITALIAFLVGVLVMRPAALEAGRLSAGLAGMPDGPEKTAEAGRIQSLRRRSVQSARVVAGLLGFTVLTMAVFRYV